MKEHTRFILSC